MSFLDSLIANKEEAYALGWIDKSGIKMSLDAKLSAARNSLARGTTTAAKNQLNAFINEVNAQAGKALTAEAVTLLKSNAQFLISKLP